MEFSHHSSNPLEARSSDKTNARYIHKLNRVKQGERFVPQSSDELGRWPEQELYHNHIEDVLVSRLGSNTPKPGPSRYRGASRFVDLDDHMLSDDPLSQPYVEESTTLDPRKEFGGCEDVDEETERKDDDDKDDEQAAAKELMYDEDVIANGTQGQEEEDEDEEGGYNIPEEDEEMHDDDDDNFRSRSYSPHSELTPRSSNFSSPISSPQSSRPSSPNEYLTITKRPKEEQEEIEAEIKALYKSVPTLVGSYELVDRLGTGTFSSVYKAVDSRYDEWYNNPWLGDHPPESSAFYQSAGPAYKGRGGRAAGWRHTNEDVNMDAEGVHSEGHSQGKVFVAIKRIYTTSGPDRIRNEIGIMEECRSCRHASQIITAFRNEDQVVLILPYQRNMDFREFYQDLHPEGIKSYFRCLFRALRDIHARGIIHRDVKPANFLYNPYTGIGTLCDFGLASRMENPSQYGQCFHTPPSDKDPHGKNVSLSEEETNLIKKAQRVARSKGLMPAEKVGFPEQDKRPVSKANRAGTRGFRAPEVLLKCGAQSGAIDVWSAGVILLFFLTGKFPIFQSNDDIEGLMEIAVIIGKKNLEKAATLHGRTISTNVPDIDQEGVTWREFVERLNPEIVNPRKYDMRYYPHNSKHKDGRGSMLPPATLPLQSSSPTAGTSEISDSTAVAHPDDPSTFDAEKQGKELTAEEAQAITHAERHANPPSLDRHAKEMNSAFSFLEAVLHFESTKRFTPRKALYHKFLEEPGVPGDDAFVPHRVGEGICEVLHFRDDQTDVHCAKIMRRCLCQSAAASGSGTGKKKRRQAIWDSDDQDVVNLDSDLEEDEDECLAQDDEPDSWCGEYIEEIKELSPGEGVAVGKQPCEFHRNLEFDQESGRFYALH